MASDNKEILYLERAKNELDLAKAIFKLSTENKLKLEFELKLDATFFSNVISNAYYCIFYSAKALLYTKGIITNPPEEHNKTLKEFEKLVNSGEIDVELLRIYKSIVVKADELIGIFKREKSKRGKFTYKKLPQANLEPARESVSNAEKFFKNINLIIQKDRKVGC
ncbi:MAG: HEPN domain-containing protein [Nanoarchaeota archaeon]|nr:HEPN domain-containing protein [Nanoarchaeota archaeon]